MYLTRSYPPPDRSCAATCQSFANCHEGSFRCLSRYKESYISPPHRFCFCTQRKTIGAFISGHPGNRGRQKYTRSRNAPRTYTQRSSHVRYFSRSKVTNSLGCEDVDGLVTKTFLCVRRLARLTQRRRWIDGGRRGRRSWGRWACARRWVNVAAIFLDYSVSLLQYVILHATSELRPTFFRVNIVPH